MNKTHRTIFNIATGTWVAASETAKSRTKSAGQRALVRHAIALAAVTLGLGATQAFAYVAGNGAQQGNANNTVIGDNADGSAAGCNTSYLPGSACSTIIGNSASSTAGATTAIGDHARTTGANSVAIGAYATASSWSQAIGAGATATGGWATAIGQNAVASASNALSLGTNSSATGDTSVAVGSAAKATGTNSFALGYSANAQGVDSMAFGRSVTVAGDKSVALGSAAKTTGDNAMALGANTSAVAGSVALGQSSIADRANTVSVGSSTAQRQITNLAAGTATTDAVNVGQLNTAATQLGNQITNVSNNLTQLGDQISNGQIGLVQQSGPGADLTIGAGTDGARVDFADKGGNTRTLANISSGVADTDAVNVQQLKPAVTALGGGAKIDANTGVVTGPTYNVQGGTQHDVGTALDAIDGGLKTAQNNIVNLDGRVTNNETSILNLQQQIGQGSIGLVQQDAATRNITVAGGTDGAVVDFTGTAGARRLTGVAEGSADTDAINVSQLKKTGLIDNNGNTLAAVTYDLHADGTANYNSVTLGGTQAAGPVQLHNVADGAADTDAVNLRQLKQAGLVDQNGNALDAVTYDAGSNRTSVTFGSAGTPVLLSNVRAGMADTDAANVGQLRGLAGSLGGGAGFAPDGSFVAPTYTLNNTTYNTVGDALNGLAVSIGQTGDRVTTIEKVISTGASNAHVATTGDQANTASATGNTAVAIGAGASAQHDNSVALGAGSTTDRDNTVSVGSAGNERVVANVADAVMSTDAVNKRSMDAAVSGANSYTDQKVGMVQQALGDVSRKAYSGIAGATALTMIPDVDAGKTVAVGVGVATYEGYTASAIGVSTRLSDRIKAKFGASISGSSSTYGAGVSYQW